MMKYLYLIFRLFKCPHKYIPYGQSNQYMGKKVIGISVVKNCSKCGKMKKFVIAEI